MNNFTQFGINPVLIRKLEEKKISNPTKIQQEVIPKILNNEDIIAQSKTGTGKTIAYLLPVIHRLLKNKEPVLILAPTNELATQIYQETLFFIANTDITAILLSGAHSIDKQTEDLKKSIDILIGVPGRILKLTETGILKLPNIKKFILDEADFLIDLGFIEDIRKIFNLGKNIRQIMVFSATLSLKTKKILNIINNQKLSSRVDTKNQLPENIENFFFPIQDEERETTLFKIIKAINPYLCIIFTRTKQISLYLYKKMKENNISVTCLNGDLTPSQRKRAIKEFKEAKVQYLVATDLASRGLDIEMVTHIINYNLPVNELDYLHRAGRTGRMNEKGSVYSLCNELDEGYLKKYADILNITLTPVRISKTNIQPYPKYQGVKPRFNLEEIKKRKQIKQKEIQKNAQKKERNKRRR